MKQYAIALIVFSCVVPLIGCMECADPSEQTPAHEPSVHEPNASEPKEIDPSETPSPQRSTKPASDTAEVLGTIVYKQFEGGFFAIDGDDGRKYNPINLPQSFKKDGLRVKVTVRLKRNAISFRMYGTVVDVVSITPR